MLRTIRDRPKLFWHFSILPPANYLTPSSNEFYTKFQKKRTKSCSKGFAKYLSSEKYILDHEKDQNRNFCQARMKVYGLEG